MERMKFSPEGGNGMSDICSDDGAVKVSTGAVKLDKRAEAPGLHKTGNFSKLTDNSKVALAA